MARVLVVTNLYPPHSYGGYESLCRSAVAHWRAGGDEVSVLTSDFLRPERAGEPEDTCVRRTLPMYWSEHRVLHPTLAGRRRIEATTRDELLATVDRFGPEVLSVWNLAGLSVGLLRYARDRGIRVVAVVGDRWPDFAPELDAWARLFDRRGAPGRALGRLVTAATGLSTTTPADVPVSFLCASRHLADDVEANGRFRRERVEVVPHGVDLDAFPVTRRDTAAWAGRVLVVSRIDPRKGLATTIRALAELPELSLDVVGPGDEDHRRELEAQASSARIGDRVTFHGEADRATVRAHYLAADVAVIPSEWDEPFGIVPLEAMACGTPVLATGTGGSGEYLDHEDNCLRFAPGDAAGLATGLRRLRDDPELRRRLAAAGAGTAARFSQGRTFDALARRHHEAASARDRRPYDLPT